MGSRWNKKNFVSLEEFIKYVRSVGIRKKGDWDRLSSQKLRPKQYPSHPNQVYDNWPGWAAVLGTEGPIRDRSKFVTLEEFICFLIEQRIHTSTDWYQFMGDGHRPLKYPSYPEHIYKDWPGWKNLTKRLQLESKGEPRYLRKRMRDRSNFASLEEFTEYVRGLEFRTNKDWLKLSTDGLRPLRYPSNPDKFYENWPGWKKVLGDKSSRAIQRSQYCTYRELQELVREKGIRYRQELLRYAKECLKDGSGNKLIPKDVPKFYESEWTSWEDLFGRPSISHLEKLRGELVDVETFVEFIKGEKSIRSRLDYRNWLDRNPGLSPCYPSDPEKAYGDSFPGWTILLGLENDGLARRKIRPLQEFKEFIKAKNIRSRTDWEVYCKNGGNRENFPRIPHLSYSGKFPGWKKFLEDVWRDDFASLKEFTAYIRKQQIMTLTDWRKLSSQGLRPHRYPSFPHIFYENWPGWETIVAPIKKRVMRRSKYFTYEEVKTLVRSQELRSRSEIYNCLRRAAKETRKSVPSYLPNFYKNEWISWDDLIGQKVIRTNSRNRRR